MSLSFIRVRHHPNEPWDVVASSEGVSQELLPEWADAYPASEWEWVPGRVLTDADHDAWLRMEDVLDRAITAVEYNAIQYG